MRTKKLMAWVRKHLALVLITVFFILPAISFALSSTAILVYIFWPTDLSRITMPSINIAAKNIVLLVHGLNDNPLSWSNTLKQSFEQLLSQEPETSQAIALDWNPYSTSTLRCSVDGKRIGAALGEQMARSTQLKTVHLIGHSCGSFVILGLCEALKAERRDIQVQNTYLAPVNIYGGIFWNYGNSHFGSCADFSEAYIDHEDTVGDRVAPSNTYGFDITAVRKSNGIRFAPHIWPTVYYQLLVKSGTYPDLRSGRHLPTKFLPGNLERVEDKLVFSMP